MSEADVWLTPVLNSTGSVRELRKRFEMLVFNVTTLGKLSVVLAER